MKKKITIIIIIFIVGLFIFETVKAFDDGIVGLTRRGGNTEGCSCHGLNPSTNVNALLLGPSIVRAGDTAEYVLTITGGPLIEAGCDISAGNGLVIPSSVDTMLQRLQSSFGVYELTHKLPKSPNSGTVIFTFKYIAPNTPGSLDTIFANANSVNGNGTPDGDSWNYATDKIISVTNSVDIRNLNGIVKDFKLEQNFPNPFNPNTVIGFKLSVSGLVSLKVYDLSGKEITTIVKGNFNPGSYEVNFNGDKFGLTSGVYFYRLQSGNFIETKRMILIK